jgi:hypothetical protein
MPITGVSKCFVEHMVLSIQMRQVFVCRERRTFASIHIAIDAASSGIVDRIRGMAVKWQSGLKIRDSRADLRAGIKCDRCERETVKKGAFANHFKQSWKMN